MSTLKVDAMEPRTASGTIAVAATSGNITTLTVRQHNYAYIVCKHYHRPVKQQQLQGYVRTQRYV
jgi:hypothetical protein